MNIFKNRNHKFIDNQSTTLFILLFILVISAYSFKIKSNNNKHYNSEYDFNKDSIQNENKIYKKNIKTVLLHRDGWELSPAIIHLNKSEKLKLSFDDLDRDVKYYKYKLIHCDADWQTSDILSSDYIDGFTEDDINNYQFSFNTTQSYTHYYLIFPTENLKITKSGNYVIKVYINDDNPENVAFTSRFMVLEPKVTVKGRVKRASNINDRNCKQEVDFKIFKQNYSILNPYKDLEVIITQNYRWDNAIKDTKPIMIKGDELDYDYSEQNIFNGANEFRNFDIKSMKYQSERINKIVFNNSGYNVYLYKDESKRFKNYVFEKDINGKRLIKKEDASNSETESDYIYVHFFLSYNAPIVDGNIYVFGALTNWQFTKDGLMKYNYEKQGYETSLYLKQGYYNYEYVFLENGETKANAAFIEGNHYETENDYFVYVYHREQGEYYDKLIAVKKLNSLQND